MPSEDVRIAGNGADLRHARAADDRVVVGTGEGVNDAALGNGGEAAAGDISAEGSGGGSDAGAGRRGHDRGGDGWRVVERERVRAEV